MKNMEDVDVNDVLYAVNKYIKYKTSARKSYIRTKILKKDDKCDITQLCYALYNATENKTVVVKIEGRWQLIRIEAGRIFTGPGHNMKAIKYFDKKTQEKDNGSN